MGCARSKIFYIEINECHDRTHQYLLRFSRIRSRIRSHEKETLEIEKVKIIFSAFS